jgi:uncharacterized protein
MSHQPVIDGLEFARAGSRLNGAWPVAEFPRLRDVLRTEAGSLSYELQGVPEVQGRPALRLRVEGALQLNCQRCLGALEFPYRIDVELLLAATQAEADAEPLDADGPDCIVAGREMPVRAIVEDEVLLAIPIAPRHAACGEGERRDAGSATDARAAKQMPFAGLRGLIGGTKH